MYVGRSIVLLLVGISLRAQQSGLQKEAALGSQMASELRRHTTVIEDFAVQPYLNSLGRRLGAEMPDAKFPFTFSVIAGDPCAATHEPASLPGGYVFVPAALFIEAHAEAEFAGMLAHSMEHVAAGRTTSGRTANFGEIPLIFVGGWAGHCLENTAIPVGFVAGQRSNELEADHLALEAMARAGFDPQALVDFLKRLQASDIERVAAMNLTIERPPALDYEVTSSQFVAIQERMLSYSKAMKSAGVPALRRN